MDGSPGFGSNACYIWSPYSDSVSLWLREYPLNLQHTVNSVAHSTKGTRSLWLRLAATPSSHLLVSIKVSGYYFTPLTGVLFTFPSRYLFTIGQIRYLALERDRPRFLQGSSCLVVLRYTDHGANNYFIYGTITLYGGPFQAPSTIVIGFYLRELTFDLCPTTPGFALRSTGASPDKPT